MGQSMQVYSTSSNTCYHLAATFLCILLLMATNINARAKILSNPASATTVKYSAMIELPKAYLSGVCILKTENDTITGCIFNEFGISAIEFVRYPGKKKAKILSVIKMLDKWYIKRVLNRDIAHVIDNLQKGEGQYRDERYKISYKFIPISDDHATEE